MFVCVEGNSVSHLHNTHPPSHPHTGTGGHYFASHYYLGNRKFQTGEPELFLFGDLPDVNYLPSKPTTVRVSVHVCELVHVCDEGIY